MPWRRRLFLLLYAASGAAALVYEIAWTRLLTLQIGHTVAAVSTVLAAFMGGLALGSWLGGRFDAAVQRRSSSPAVIRLRAYAACEAAIAIIAIVLPAMLAAFVPLLAWAYRQIWRHSAPCASSLLRSSPCRRPRWARRFRSPSAGTPTPRRTPGSCTANTAGAAVGALAPASAIPSIRLRDDVDRRRAESPRRPGRCGWRRGGGRVSQVGQVD
jgi:hypothetical protein